MQGAFGQALVAPSGGAGFVEGVGNGRGKAGGGEPHGVGWPVGGQPHGGSEDGRGEEPEGGRVNLGAIAAIQVGHREILSDVMVVHWMG